MTVKGIGKLTNSATELTREESISLQFLRISWQVVFFVSMGFYFYIMVNTTCQTFLSSALLIAVVVPVYLKMWAWIIYITCFSNPLWRNFNISFENITLCFVPILPILLSNFMSFFSFLVFVYGITEWTGHFAEWSTTSIYIRSNISCWDIIHLSQLEAWNEFNTSDFFHGGLLCHEPVH